MTQNVFADYDVISDTAANRPATPTVAGGRLCVFFATDTGKISIWNGTAWKVVPVSATDISDFSAGNWVPTDVSGAGLALTITTAKFLHFNIMGFFSIDVTYPATASALQAILSLPFTLASTTDEPFYATSLTSFGLMACIAGNNYIPLFTQAGAVLKNSDLSGATCRLATCVVTS